MAESAPQAILDAVQNIPPLPAAVQKLTRLVQDPEADMDEVVKLVSSDPVLTGRLLKMATSPIYGLSRQISTVNHAILVLGLETLGNICMSTSVLAFKELKTDNKDINYQNILRHSIAVSIVAQELGKLAGFTDPSELFTSGLLHDLGKLVLMNTYPEAYDSILVRSQTEKTPSIWCPL